MWNDGEALEEIKPEPEVCLHNSDYEGQPVLSHEKRHRIQSISNAVVQECSMIQHHSEDDCKDNKSDVPNSIERVDNDMGQRKRARKGSKIFISDENRKNMNKEASHKTRQQKRIEYAVLKSKLFLLRQENHKLRQAAISHLPRSAEVVALLNNSFQIPFEVTAELRDYTPPDFATGNLAKVTSTVPAGKARVARAPRVSFTSMQDSISFCILDATTDGLRIKHASTCFCTQSGATNLVGRSFRSLVDPLSNAAQFAVLKEALSLGRGATIHVVHYSTSGAARTIEVALVHPKVGGSSVSFLIARHVGSMGTGKLALPIAGRSHDTHTSYGQYGPYGLPAHHADTSSYHTYFSTRSSASSTSATSTNSSAAEVFPNKQRCPAVSDNQTRNIVRADSPPMYITAGGHNAKIPVFGEQMIPCGGLPCHSFNCQPLASTLATTSEESTESMLAEFLLSPDVWECYSGDRRCISSPRAVNSSAGSLKADSRGGYRGGCTGAIAGDHVASLTAAMLYERSVNAHADQCLGQYPASSIGKQDQKGGPSNDHSILQNKSKFYE